MELLIETMEMYSEIIKRGSMALAITLKAHPELLLLVVPLLIAVIGIPLYDLIGDLFGKEGRCCPTHGNYCPYCGKEIIR
ncbi:MAG: hypothetical protein KAR20_20080 [Candidatus Heimdallarchaeota archaeon]|nr:hypothetical protein [Candidatus Heimdallarchaeota archaeon]